MAESEMIGAWRPWRFTATETRALWIAFLIGLGARAGGLLYTASTDDFVFLTNPAAGRFAFDILVTNGRFAGGVLLRALSVLGMTQPHANVLGIVLGTLALALTGVIACRLWRLPGGAAPAAIVTCLISIHPYQADIATYRVTYLVVCLAFLLAAAGAFLLLETRVPLLVPTVILSLAYAMYQVAISYALMVLVGAWWLSLIAPEGGVRREAAVLRRAVIAVLASLPVYFLASAAALAVTGLQAAARVSAIAPSQLGERAGNLLGLIRKLAFEGEPIVPGMVKALLLLLLVGAVCAVASRRLREGGARAGLLAVLIAMVMVSLLSLLMVAHLFVVVEWWPAARTLSQIGVFWGLIFAAGYAASEGRGRVALLCLGGLLVACFAGLVNQVFLDEHRMNTRDMLRSNRIVSRLEARPDFAAVKELAVVGGAWNYPLPAATTYYDLNVSALYAPWSRVAVINEVSGYNFTATTDAGKLDAAKRYCAAAAPWPAEASVAVQGEVGVVCLGKP